MSDADIRDALRRATDDIRATPDLIDRVRAGGRARLVRRRAVLAAGLSVAVGGAGGAVGQYHRPPAPVTAADRLFDEDTRGDLRDDYVYLAAVRGAWRTKLPPSLVTIGEPHIVWAGRTPAGKVAAVAQRIVHRPSPIAGQVEYGVFGFAEGTHVPEPEPMTTAVANSTAMLVGTGRTTLVVLDTGEPVDFSAGYRYAPDGKVLRDFVPLAFDADGAAVLRVASQAVRVEVGLRTGDRRIALFDLATQQYDGGPQPLRRDLPGHRAAWPATPEERDEAAARWAGDALAPYSDRFGTVPYPGSPMWSISGATAAGNRFLLTTTDVGDGRSRVLTLYGRPAGRPSVLFGGFIAPGAPLSVEARLPDGQGRVVAAEQARLRYRTVGGPWLPVTGDAALLPDAAAEVEVTRGGRPVRVTLRT